MCLKSCIREDKLFLRQAEWLTIQIQHRHQKKERPKAWDGKLTNGDSRKALCLLWAVQCTDTSCQLILDLGAQYAGIGMNLQDGYSKSCNKKTTSDFLYCFNESNSFGDLKMKNKTTLKRLRQLPTRTRWKLFTEKRFWRLYKMNLRNLTNYSYKLFLYTVW